ncbi:MAG: TatD family hydrolase [Candidatus Binatia bacterium]|nr:TatD family hydrolase [Candidatus Binatia bacterium]
MSSRLTKRNDEVMPSATTNAAELPKLPTGLLAIDSHCHLHDQAFDQDRDQVYQRALRAGVRMLVEIGASDGLDGNRRALSFAAHHEGVYATVGIHPHDAKEATPEALATLESLVAHPRVIAVGETGLDYHYDHSPRPQQRELLRYFIDLARRNQLPLTVHLREAEDDLLEIFRLERAQEVGGVIHCFTGSWETAKRFLDLGFFLSFSGVVTFKNAEGVREVARKVPEDRFLLETDAPYLAPVPRRGRRNEPAFVLYTAECIARLRAVSLERVVERATENTWRAFPRIRERQAGTTWLSPAGVPGASASAKSD